MQVLVALIPICAAIFVAVLALRFVRAIESMSAALTQLAERRPPV